MLEVRYWLSTRWCNEQFIQTGCMPKHEQSIGFDLTEATPEQRSAIVTCPAVGKNEKDLSLILTLGYSRNFSGQPTLAQVISECDSLTATYKAYHLNEIPKLVSFATRCLIRAVEQQYPEFSFSLSDEERELAVELSINLGEYDALLQKFQLHKPDYKRAADAKKRAWIQANGSDYLNRTFDRGYDSERLYVTERAAKEAPGFTVDFVDEIEWMTASCPSTEALNIEDEVQHLGEVLTVTLMKTPDDGGLSESDVCEAVLIRQYLGVYDLIRVV